MKIHIYNDPGHGWGKVKKQLLIDLGIADKISSYSYQLFEYAYLEEDADLSVLMNALKGKGIEVQFVEHHANKPSAIRGYPHYTNTPPERPKIGDIVQVLHCSNPDALLIHGVKPHYWGESKNGTRFRLPKNQIGKILETWPCN